MSFSVNMAADASAATAIPLGAILAHHAKRNPGAPALTIEGGTVTRSELDAAANRRARLFATMNVRAGDFVTVALDNSREFYETTFAIWKLGAIPNIVSPKLPRAEFEAIVDLVRPCLIVGVGASEAHGRHSIGANVLPSDVHSSEPLESVISPHWKAMTSGGSTGRPKVIVDHMPGLWDPSITALGQTVDDVILNPGPLYHNAPLCCTHYGLFTGAHVVDMVKFDAARALELIGRYGVGWVNFVPTMLGRIMRLPADVRANADVKSLRVVFWS